MLGPALRVVPPPPPPPNSARPQSNPDPAFPLLSRSSRANMSLKGLYKVCVFWERLKVASEKMRFCGHFLANFR